MTKATAKSARKVSVSVAKSVNTALETIAVETLDARTTDDVEAIIAEIAPVTVADAVQSDAVEVDAIIAAIDTSDADAPATVTLRERALAFDQAAVDATIADINAAFAVRDGFEQVHGLDIADRSTSYAKARAKMLANGISVARAMLALNVAPVNVITRKVVENKMFNAKGLDKVTEVCAFICGNGASFQSVTKAFIACAVAVAEKNDAAIGNKVNKLFLTNASFDKLVNDAELANYIRDYQHKFMSGGKDTQSSQVRNVLDVLGLATICTVERARGGIQIDKEHAFYSLFRERYMTAA